jgi:hypothetical protein
VKVKVLVLETAQGSALKSALGLAALWALDSAVGTVLAMEKE